MLRELTDLVLSYPLYFFFGTFAFWLLIGALTYWYAFKDTSTRKAIMWAAEEVHANTIADVVQVEGISKEIALLENPLWKTVTLLFVFFCLLGPLSYILIFTMRRRFTRH